jgi:pimeloyl-ACP methyl ester carboxylesterase
VVVAAATTTFTISGTVSANGKPLMGIMVTASGSTTSYYTDVNGHYSISGIAAGSSVDIGAAFGSPYTIPITADGPNSGYFYNITANHTQNFSAARYTTVYLLHGIGQSYLPMRSLEANLTGANGKALDLSRFLVDASFDFSECAAAGASCTTSNLCSISNGVKTCAPCSVSAGGQKLATQYLVNAPWDIVLVGYSMGGLIARDVLVHGNTAAYGNVLATHNVRGLVTLGTPHWGYPMVDGIDNLAMCPQLVTDMAGSWNPNTGQANPLSPFLSAIDNGNWDASKYGVYWLAAAGRFCNSPWRVDVNNPGVPLPTGCLESPGVNSNDGVVCADSALYSSAATGAPTDVFNDLYNKYAHTDTLMGFGTALMFGLGCKASPSANPQLFDPRPDEDPFKQIVAVINGN